MGTTKTAVSLSDRLFKEADALARELKVSRSRLFADALEEFISRRRNRRILEKLNEAYGEETDVVERNYMRKMRRKHRKLVQGQW